MKDTLAAPASGLSAAPVQLDLSGVSVRLGGRPVLSGLDLSLASARLGVVGRNGSGKSTLSRLLAGLIRPDGGTVRVNGRDLFADRRAALAEVGILFQNPDHQVIFPTVIEEIAFGLTQQGRPRAEAEEVARRTLAAFGVAHWDGAYVETLSQGQRHLLCLMAVAAMRPRLMILDEPFAGLDIPTRAQLRRALGRHEGALVHVSHDPDDLADCDRVLWLDGGGVRAEGPAGAVLEAYVAEMTRAGERDDLADLAG
ncbi:energy-coupling factor ABC transporter ATP-binding protein [Wenxinia marina]|uniref:ABC-type cobalt transport system, ATPase component n=1 Tax=Wenxinia marina DSM 24838 TaxID=1123501 RepID=A0A0D0Q6G5_9RHOB|nr:ABC transporter ATP-binding protein [Wenxinia marina]KIQ70049.1 ABC-type cobalt transport system, ATPase component [Wenxinia marina DSM 24838]GGL63140.1 cobalt ABC transporter [Wenxinia marina]